LAGFGGGGGSGGSTKGGGGCKVTDISFTFVLTIENVPNAETLFGSSDNNLALVKKFN
jgi:hypothetical protein